MKRSMTFFLSLICATAMMAAPVAMAAETETETAVTEMVSEAETETGSETETEAEGVLEDGTYTAEFDTDSSMFHVNEANEGKGVLTVKDGEMTIHVSLSGKGFLNLFMGSAEDAKKDGAELLLRRFMASISRCRPLMKSLPWQPSVKKANGTTTKSASRIR